MNQRWIAGVGACVVALTLTACTSGEPDTKAMDEKVTEEKMTQKVKMPERFQMDGKYIADGNGRVMDSNTKLTQWEQMTRTMQESWQDWMDEAERAMEQQRN